MTDQEIDEAIAEACGWEKCTCLDEHCGAWFKPDSDDPQLGVPNYCSDLNAMHEAEKVLDVNEDDIDDPRYIYSRHLYRVVALRQPCRATARQRAEAFLRTIGKWKSA